MVVCPAHVQPLFCGCYASRITCVSRHTPVERLIRIFQVPQKYEFSCNLIVGYRRLEDEMGLHGVERREYAISQCVPLDEFVRRFQFVVDVLKNSNTNIAPLCSSAFELGRRVMVRPLRLEFLRVRRVKELCAQATKMRMLLLCHSRRGIWGDQVLFVALCEILASFSSRVERATQRLQQSWKHQEHFSLNMMLDWIEFCSSEPLP